MVNILYIYIGSVILCYVVRRTIVLLQTNQWTLGHRLVCLIMSIVPVINLLLLLFDLSFLALMWLFEAKMSDRIESWIDWVFDSIDIDKKVKW